MIFYAKTYYSNKYTHKYLVGMTCGRLFRNRPADIKKRYRYGKKEKTDRQFF